VENKLLDKDNNNDYYKRVITKVCKDFSCVHCFNGYCLYPKRPECNYKVASGYKEK